MYKIVGSWVIFGTAFFVIAYFVNEGSLKVPIVYATKSENISGWGRGHSIGWISFNSTDCDQNPENNFYDTGKCKGGNGITMQVKGYGVNVDTTTKKDGGKGDFLGYAWNPMVGWISFNPVHLTNCPSGICKAQVDWGTGKVTGWARMTVYPAGSGWIKLSDDTITGWTGKGVKIVNGNFSGSAYSDFIGRIDFDPKYNNSPVGPTISSTCTPDMVNAGNGSWGSCLAPTVLSACFYPEDKSTNKVVRGTRYGICSTPTGTATTGPQECGPDVTISCPEENPAISGGSGSGGSGSTTKKKRFWQF